MRIAYYSHYFTPEIGAPSMRLHDLSRQWLTIGHDVQVVTCFPNHPTGVLYPGYSGGLAMRERLDGVDVLRHWTYITPNKGILKKTLGHITYLPSAMLLSDHRLANPNVTIGSSPTFFAAIAAAGAAARRRIPFVMEVRDLWPAIFVELGVLKDRRIIAALERLELALYRRATRIVTVTEAFRRNLIERGVPEEKVATVPNGADDDFWRPQDPPSALRAKLGLVNRCVVLYIGAHGISHGLARILDAAETLRHRPDIQFLFVGEGAEKANLEAQARRVGLGNVRFLDSVDKAAVREFYALADVCLVPLRDIPLFDTFIPSKMFEIMAMGRPIVASVRGEAAAILERSGAAVVTPPETSAAIAEAILRLVDRPEERRVMGERGRAFVTAHYSRRALAGNYLDILEEAVVSYRGNRR
ncbi:MAG TPA: glycosyltransferase family 4 protein [Thermomicrobiales bacterium]|jgi:glycosyltransferase involved in cell wall biosynthesis